MHWAQALTRLPESNLTHCKLGYFLFWTVGLYLPRNFTSLVAIREPLPQIEQVLGIIFLTFL